MKKLLSFLLVLVFIPTLVSCGSDSPAVSSQPIPSAVQSEIAQKSNLTMDKKMEKITKGVTTLDEAIQIFDCKYYSLPYVSNDKITYYIFTDGVVDVYLDVDTKTKIIERKELVPLDKQTSNQPNETKSTDNLTSTLPTNAPGITWEEYSKIQIGMTYDEVCDIIGSEGKEDVSTATSKSYSWHAEKGYGGAVFSFVFGRLSAKSNSNLD